MMTRGKHVATYLEYHIFEILRDDIVGPRNTSFSSYMRALLVQDMINKGKLPPHLRDVALLGIENLVTDKELQEAIA